MIPTEQCAGCLTGDSTGLGLVLRRRRKAGLVGCQMGKNSAIRRQAAPEDTGRDMEQDIVNPGPVTHWEKDLHDAHL